jgi:4-amino-4-deoxy-L-arabinose transferase-like glycosyltransferase
MAEPPPPTAGALAGSASPMAPEGTTRPAAPTAPRAGAAIHSAAGGGAADRRARRSGQVALALAILFAVLWLCHVLGSPPPAAFSRLAALAAAVATAVWAALRTRANARRLGWAGLLLPGLLALSLLVRFSGLTHEVEGRYYADEGTYYHHAKGIEGGEPLRLSFTYPHLLYYLEAVALWLLRLFPEAAAALGATMGFTDPLSVPWLTLRGVVALLSALTVVPVFRIAERLGGLGAAAAASLLLVFSPLYNAGSHLNTCDVPSAFFATLCLLFASRLVDAERTADYLLAGVCAGLAAASKYPAGFVAVAIVAVWLRWRFARRDFRPGLVWAGLAAIGAMVAAMPSLIAFPGPAFTGHRGMFFGYRQYGRGGWLGVMPRSNVASYARDLLESFGVAAVVVGLVGLLLVPRGERRRWLWHTPFPLAYLTLISSMNMVVKRNLYPVLPILAVLLGVGIAAWLVRLRQWQPAGRRAVVLGAALVAVCLAAPVAATAVQTVAMTRPSTRDLAAAWIADHLPPGASIVKEAYTPRLPEEHFAVRHLRFVTRLPMRELREFDYVLVASTAYARFGDSEALFQPHQQRMARRYEALFGSFTLVREWHPAPTRLGPLLRLYRSPVAADGVAGEEAPRARVPAPGEPPVATQSTR